jgi:hypothetical protein
MNKYYYRTTDISIRKLLNFLNNEDFPENQKYHYIDLYKEVPRDLQFTLTSIHNSMSYEIEILTNNNLEISTDNGPYNDFLREQHSRYILSCSYKKDLHFSIRESFDGCL